MILRMVLMLLIILRIGKNLPMYNGEFSDLAKSSMYEIPKGIMGVSPIPRIMFPTSTYIHINDFISFTHSALKQEKST